jgi:tRNA(Ile2) C34 agmatinyltransferase TiaS
MKNINIEKFSPEVSKYKKIIDDILYAGEKKLENKNNIIAEKRVARMSSQRLRQSRWKFKSCPRCRGDLNSCYGEDFSCYQCGYIEYSWIRKEENYKGGYYGKAKES